MADYLLAQSSVLGSMIIDSRCVGDVIHQLRPEDFTEDMGREIFLAIRDLFLEGAKIDPVTVLNRMGPPSEDRRKYVLALMDKTPTAANVREYVAIVREQSRLREIQSLGLRLASTGTTLAEARGLIAQLDGMMVDRPGVEALTMEQGLLDFYAEQERKPEYLRWGIEFLDEGLTAEQSDYIVLGGYPSDGKTALALRLAYEQAATKRVGFFSLETKNSKLFNRIFASVANVSGTRVKRRTLTQSDWDSLAGAADSIKARDLQLIRSSSMTVEDIGSYARSQRFDVIYIDYLTLIQAPGRTEFDQATYISKALHRLAQDNNITVVALSQLSRPESGKAKPPTLASLRSSGQIEQDADIVMFIYREQPGELRSRRVLKVAKNKEGVTGSIPLLFDGETQTFKVDTYAEIRRMAKKPPKEQPEYKQVEFVDLTPEEVGELPWPEKEKK